MPDRPVSKVIAGKAFATCAPEFPVTEAACLMKQQHEGCVLVVAKGRLVGICTERDIVFRLVSERLDPAVTPVGRIMTADPQTIPPDRPFGHALHLMFEGGFRHMPVVDESGRPLGVVSARDALGLDVLRFEEELEIREGLSEVM